MKLYAIHVTYNTVNDYESKFDWMYSVAPFMNDQKAKELFIEDLTEGQEDIKPEDIEIIELTFDTLDERNGYEINLKEL